MIQNKLPEIKWFDINDKSVEEFDKLQIQRFNIKNFTDVNDFKMNNFYVFRILDIDKNSKTGWYGMCINKEFAKTIKENLEKWKTLK